MSAETTTSQTVPGGVRAEDGTPAPSALQDFDPRQLRHVLGDFATGVTILACEREGSRMAMTANAFTSVSLEPPLVLVSVGNGARMLPHLAHESPFSISILSGGQEDVARCYASSRNPPDEAHWKKVNGLPVVSDAVVHFGCRVIARHEHGDHHVLVAQVDWLTRKTDCSVLTFHRGQFGSIA